MNHFLVVILSLFAILFILPQSAFASRLYLSPGGGNITVGGSKTVQVRLNTGGEGVNAVSAFLSYPADKLDVAWVSPTGTFAIEAEKSYGGGIIKISRGSLSGVSGDIGVASISFKGKAAGSATVSFIGGSAAPRASDSSDSLNLGSSGGGVFTIGGSAQPAAGKSNGGPAQPGTTTETSTLSISDIQVTKIATNSATITWKTNQESDSYIEYGLEKDAYFLTESNPTMVASHGLTLENPMMKAGLKFHFRVHSKDQNGNEAIGEDQEFQLEGYPVTVKVVSEAGVPINQAEVNLYSEPQTAVTDSRGEAVFKNVTEGKHLVVVKLPNGEKTAEVNVLGTSKEPTSIAVKVPQQLLAKPITNTNLFVIAGVVGVVLILMGVGIVLIKRKKGKDQPPNVSIPPQTITQGNSSTTNST